MKRLPTRVYLKHNAYYYVTLPDRKWIRLGKSEAQMYKSLAKIADLESGRGTMTEYFIRYENEIIPTKAETTQKDNLRELLNLKRAFGHMNPESIKPKHIYAYMDARKTAKVAANHEKSLLSHVFSYMIRWGIVESNPCREVKKFTEKPRTRYIEDSEYFAFKDFVPPMIQAAMEVAVITGLRRGDLLSLKSSDLENERPIVTNKTGKKVIFELTPDLIAAIKLAKTTRVMPSIYLITNKKGLPYSLSGFSSNWGFYMKKAVESGVLTEKFRLHDLRAKAGSDHNQGDRLLGHQDPKTTRRHYERKPIKVQPIR